MIKSDIVTIMNPINQKLGGTSPLLPLNADRLTTALALYDPLKTAQPGMMRDYWDLSPVAMNVVMNHDATTKGFVEDAKYPRYRGIIIYEYASSPEDTNGSDELLIFASRLDQRKTVIYHYPSATALDYELGQVGIKSIEDGLVPYVVAKLS